MPESKFYGLYAETDKLFLFMCAISIEEVVSMAQVLIHLYDLKETGDGSDKNNYIHTFQGSPKEIKDTFVNGVGIAENRLTRVSQITHELDKIFTGQTKQPLVYTDGKDEDVKNHFKKMEELIPGHFDNNPPQTI